MAMRVRFAPSPTGPLHIGGARSALFNWLLARKSGGKFIVRTEDTDLERSKKEFEDNILESIKWLGMDWDEGPDIGGDYGPYRQTERLDTYQEFTDRLLNDGKAYKCYCSEAEIDAERQAAQAKGETPKYSGKCAHLSEEEQKALEAQGKKFTVRLRVPLGEQIVFDDLVRGTVSFESDGVGDFVLVKSDGIPVYNYAVVIDDLLMKITHVIRAEEHLSNTPRQILIYQALGAETPKFGHVSLILGKDRSKMSKRHGATSVVQYKSMGFLPEGIDNFLALLGWAPEGEEEIFTLDQLVEQFSLERVAKNPAVFDMDKLIWVNGQHMKKLSPEELTELSIPHLVQAGYITEDFIHEPAHLEWLTKVVAAEQEHIHYAAQIVEEVKQYFVDDVEFESDHEKEMIQDPEMQTSIRIFLSKISEIDLSEKSVKDLFKAIIKESGLPGKKVFMPVRIALTGESHGPELHHLIPLLGVERSKKRIIGSLHKLGIKTE